MSRASFSEDIEGSELKTQNATLKTPSLVLGTLLRQIGDVLDGLTGQQLDLWQVEGLWYWRWEDTGALSPRGLRSCGEVLVDVVEQCSGIAPGDGHPKRCEAWVIVAEPRQVRVKSHCNQ